MTGGAPVRVVIADDHAVVRDGLRALVEAQPELRVVGEAADGDAAYRQACALAPDVLLLDLSMPGGGGADAAARIAQDCPRVRILALTMHEERGYVTRLLRAGAAGYVLKRTASAELVRAIRTVAAGATYVDPSLAGALLPGAPALRAAHPNGVPRPADAPAGPADRAGVDGAGTLPARGELTARERAVVRLVARGHSNKEVAAALDLPVPTVAGDKAAAMDKLGLGGRAALVRFALDQGWLRAD